MCVTSLVISETAKADTLEDFRKPGRQCRAQLHQRSRMSMLTARLGRFVPIAGPFSNSAERVLHSSRSTDVGCDAVEVNTGSDVQK